MTETTPDICRDRACLPRCPTCGEPIESFDYVCDTQIKVEVEEMWPGGPTVEVSDMLGRLERTPGSGRCVAHPCGHPVPPSVLVFTSHTSPEHPPPSHDRDIG